MRKKLIAAMAGLGILALGYSNTLNDNRRPLSIDTGSAYASSQPVSYGNYVSHLDGSQSIEVYSGPCNPLSYPFQATNRDGDGLGLADRLQTPQGELSRIVDSDYSNNRCEFDDADYAFGIASKRG